MKKLFCVALMTTGLGCAAAPVQSPSNAPIPRSLIPQLGIRVTPAPSSFLLLAEAQPARPDRALEWQTGTNILALDGRADFLDGQGVKVARVAPKAPTAEPVAPYTTPQLRLSFSERGAPLSDLYRQREITDNRFWYQLAEGFGKNFQRWWNDDTELIMRGSPLHGTGLHDPFYHERTESAWELGDRQYKRAIRKSLKGIDVGERAVDQMKDWREEPVNFFFALIGGGVDQDTPEGGHLTIGPAWDGLPASDRPSQVLRVRYDNGPLTARVEWKDVWTKLEWDILGFTVFGRAKYGYLDQDSSFQGGLNRRFFENTTLHVFGGTGISSETLIGYQPFPVDRRRSTNTGLIAYIEQRF